jgi:uncharacterized surface protein with fasciclin (FAS1) repeats
VRNNTSIESNGAHKEPTNKHMIRKSIIIVTLGVAAFAATLFAYENSKVGGAAMSQEKNIVQNASASADHTTLVTALKAADLVATLEGTGPFTVFAPTNDAFDKHQPEQSIRY